jgi:hypothetical protein
MGFYKAREIVRYPNAYSAPEVREAAHVLDEDRYSTRDDWSFSTMALALVAIRGAGMGLTA